jgi:two-component system response regulator
VVGHSFITKVILLVEDNPDDEALTLRALTKANLANPVVVVRDGAEALDWLFVKESHATRDPSLEPQVVLLDLNLPKIDGLAVLRAIRGEPKTRHLPVVVLTSSNEDKDVIESYQLGANSYVCKPVEFDRFVSAVQQLGLYWVLLNQTR